MSKPDLRGVEDVRLDVNLALAAGLAALVSAGRLVDRDALVALILDDEEPEVTPREDPGLLMRASRRHRAAVVCKE